LRALFLRGSVRNPINSVTSAKALIDVLSQPGRELPHSNFSRQNLQTYKSRYLVCKSPTDQPE
jgi:hypothetical protein